MNNNIVYRQDAINSIKELPRWIMDPNGEFQPVNPPTVSMIDPEDAVSAIENLPSAQPKVRTQMSSADCISRQAAIDALMEFDKKLRKINWYQYPYTEHECRGVDEAIVKIANLPSAQPEIIRCKDCEWFESIGCAIGGAISIIDDSDRPTENDFCSFAKRRNDG